MADLPDVVERFIADVLPYVRDVERAAREADQFSERNSEAGLAARRMGLAAQEAAERAERAQRNAAEAAERLARGEGDAEQAAQAAARAMRELERADIAQTRAAQAAARSADNQADQYRQLAREATLASAAQRLAQLRASGSVREHNQLLAHLRNEFGDLGRDGSGAFTAIAEQGSVASRLLGSAAESANLGWITMVAKVTAAIAALPAIAVVASSGIVLALGGGLAAIGIMAAAESKKVKAAFSSLGKHVKSVMKDISTPFQDTLTKIAGFARRTFDNFSPDLKKAFASMAPVITKFADQFFRALDQLRPAIKPLTDGFNALMTALGPAMPGIMKSIADTIIILANTVKENPDLLPKLLGNVAAILPQLADFIDKLAKVFDWMDRNKGAINSVTQVLKYLMSPIFVAIDGANLLSAAARRIKDAFNSAKSGISGAVSSARDAVSSAFGAMRNAVSSRLSGIVSLARSLPGRIRSAVGNLGSILYGAGQAVINGLISGVRSMIGSLINAVSPIAGIIKSVKGPIEKDRVLLVPEGQAIMGGLIGGIIGQIPALKSALGTVTGSIALPGPGASGLALAGAAGGRGNVTNVHLHIAGTVVAERQLIETVRAGLAGISVLNPGRNGATVRRAV